MKIMKALTILVASQLVLGLSAFAQAGQAVDTSTEKLELTQEWDKVFPNRSQV